MDLARVPEVESQLQWLFHSTFPSLRSFYPSSEYNGMRHNKNFAKGVRLWSSAVVHYSRQGLCAYGRPNEKSLNSSSTPALSRSSDRDTNHSLEGGVTVTARLSQPWTATSQPLHSSTALIILYCPEQMHSNEMARTRRDTCCVQTQMGTCVHTVIPYTKRHKAGWEYEKVRRRASSSASIQWTAEYIAGTKW